MKCSHIYTELPTKAQLYTHTFLPNPRLRSNKMHLHVDDDPESVMTWTWSVDTKLSLDTDWVPHSTGNLPNTVVVDVPANAYVRVGLDITVFTAGGNGIYIWGAYEDLKTRS